MLRIAQQVQEQSVPSATDTAFQDNIAQGTGDERPDLDAENIQAMSIAQYSAERSRLGVPPVDAGFPGRKLTGEPR